MTSLTLQVPIKKQSTFGKTRPLKKCEDDLCFSNLSSTKESSPVRIDTGLGEGDFTTGCASIVKTPFIPDSASEKESRIFNFLNKMCAFQVNVQEMIKEESTNKFRNSPILQEEFSKIKRNVSPSFLVKRREKSNSSSLSSSPYQISSYSNTEKKAFEWHEGLKILDSAILKICEKDEEEDEIPFNFSN